MDAIPVALVMAITLGAGAARAGTAGTHPMHLAAASPACTVKMRLGQTHPGQGDSMAHAGRMQAVLDEYLALHAHAREAIQRSAMLPGAELRPQARRGEHQHQHQHQ